VPGLGDTHVEMVDVPVRDANGYGRRSSEISDAIGEAIGHAEAAGRHPLVHIVHGSKTGLILPTLDDVDRLRAEHDASFVVDACQARITPAAVADYLRRGVIVFVTGSKFMGGPPFSGFALVPPALARDPRPLPEGFVTLFRRAEWPAAWPGADRLPDTSNLGLLLRLEASIFELERFQRLSPHEVERVILAFHAAVRAEIVEKLGVRRVAPYPPGDKVEADTHPIEMRTLSTLDLSGLLGGPWSFEDAQRWHQDLLAHGIRLGQPVKCVKLADGRWGATLRIGLTMWQLADHAALDQAALAASFEADMRRIAGGLRVVAADRRPSKPAPWA
jgi:selenocysteine lyase/cysteine desulfurase